MALTQVSTGGIKDSNVTTADIADQAVSLDKLPHGTSSNNGKFLRANNGADPTFETVSTDLVNDTSPQLGGDLDSNGHDISVNSALIEIRHSSCHLDFMETGTTNHRLRNGSGNFHIQRISDDKNTTTTQFLVDGGTGAVELYHNGTKMCETSANGLAFVSGKGIDFSATSDASGKTSELLDDYEEGTWTPVIMYYSSTWGNATLDAAGTLTVPRYTKIGRWVTASFNWEGFQVNSGTTGYAQIGGLPFTATATGAGLVSLNTCFSNDQDQGAWVANGQTTAQFYRNGLSWNNWNSNSSVRLQLTCHYQAS